MAVSVDVQKKLGDFSLNVKFSSDADRIGILGASGSGKSMTLRMISGVVTPDQGKIVVGDRILYDSGKLHDRKHRGREVVNLSPQKRSIGYLFQNYALFPTMTVEENIACGLKRGEESRVKVRNMIRRLQLEGLEKRLPSELSGGQQQRAALARILVREPDAILLDEPFSALDSFLKDQLQQELWEMLADYRGIVILVSHSRDEIYRFCTSTVVLDHGLVVDAGPTKELFAAPRNAVSARLTGCRNISRAQRIDAHTIRALDWDLELHVGREVPEDIRDIGFRAHEFEPVYGERTENCLPVKVVQEADMPFERYYYLEPGGKIQWRVQRDAWKLIGEKGMPTYLHIPEDKILFLGA